MYLLCSHLPIELGAGAAAAAATRRQGWECPDHVFAYRYLILSHPRLGKARIDWSREL